MRFFCTLLLVEKRGSRSADTVLMVRPVARASAMTPREK
jgi:hypothetical protein